MSYFQKYLLAHQFIEVYIDKCVIFHIQRHNLNKKKTFHLKYNLDKHKKNT